MPVETGSEEAQPVRDRCLKGHYIWERWYVVIGSCDPKALRMDGSDPLSTSRSHTDPEKETLNKK